MKCKALTVRQFDILRRSANGYADKQIAAELGISHRTVEKHVEAIYLRLGVKTRIEAVLAVCCCPSCRRKIKSPPAP